MNPSLPSTGTRGAASLPVALAEAERRLAQHLTRRHFFSRSSLGLGALALKHLLHGEGRAAAPPSLREGKRVAFLKGNETLLGSQRKCEPAGQCGMSLSELLPHHRKIVDEVCWLRGMATDVFNHAPAKLFMNTGFQAPGRPSMGAWTTYGLGSESRDLPGFVVLQSGPRGPRGG